MKHFDLKNDDSKYLVGLDLADIDLSLFYTVQWSRTSLLYIFDL